MNFDRFTEQAWADHGDAPAAVAERIATQGLALATEPAQLPRLVHLTHHVYGDHLGHWQAGRDLLQ
ncbi:MAG: hypothetical protein H7Z19_03505, partial [Chitinophagaceae bacterium]|nr:hypothetical protein [Rubrivivax sp.]